MLIISAGKQPNQSSWPLFANRGFFYPHKHPRNIQCSCRVCCFCSFLDRFVLSVFLIQQFLFLLCCLNTSVFHSCPGQQGGDICRLSGALKLWCGVAGHVLPTRYNLEITDSRWSWGVSEHGISNHRAAVVSSFIRVSFHFSTLKLL